MLGNDETDAKNFGLNNLVNEFWKIIRVIAEYIAPTIDCRCLDTQLCAADSKGLCVLL